MMQKGSWSILDQRFLYEKYESEFEEGEGEGALDPSFRDKRIIYDEEDEPQENDSGFLQSGTMQYQTVERGSFKPPSSEKYTIYVRSNPWYTQGHYTLNNGGDEYSITKSYNKLMGHHC
ncbi:Protein Ycf2 [Datura stramonium]|uniref:Protein Ycf2 n=1 Tax=Datura stramonium TaxID=4076 RepID=A0ABS8T2L6_DATST|nr:Protein Ycf2 [Datura stramonium]